MNTSTLRHQRGAALRILLIVIAVLGGVGAYFGQDIWGLWNFKLALDEEAAVAQARGGAQMRDLAQACAGCHGIDGAGIHQYYPHLAGQPAGYLAEQLKQFASGHRRDPIMEPLAAGMSEAQVAKLADYFAASKPRPNEPADLGHAERVRGAQLAAACTACHGAALQGGSFASAGGAVVTARLSGQARDYLLRQLQAFKSGERNDASGAMKEVAKSLADTDAQVLAKYLSTL